MVYSMHEISMGCLVSDSLFQARNKYGLFSVRLSFPVMRLVGVV